MIDIRRTALGSTLATAALAVLLLTGCSGGGSDSASPSKESSPSAEAEAEQTTEEACGIANAQIQGLTTSLQEAQANAATDPASVSPALREIKTTLETTNEEITNEEVNSAVGRAADSLEGLAAVVDSALADPASVTTDDATAASTEVQESFTAVGELCGS